MTAGWQLGSDPEVQVATVVSNHLTAGIIKYFSDSFRLEHAANLFEKMYGRDPEVAALLAQSYIGMSALPPLYMLILDEEIKAVQVMDAALKQAPNSYPVLLAQVDFLLSKGKADWAREVAQQAVNSAPSEFTTWAKLSEAHIALGEFDKALLALNSCPMFTFNERDLHRMPSPRLSHLPTKKFIADSGLIDEESARDNEADVALLRLPAPGLRGTFAKAYELLTLLVSKIGWDELLKTRSSVFVMEEEYRAHRTGPSVDARDGREENGHADEDASTRGLSSPRASEDADGEEIEKPQPAQAEEEEGATVEIFEGSAFANKRLCDRWLDNLFLVLYEDLRVYTIWRAEVSHFQLQHMSYRKTGTEVSRERAGSGRLRSVVHLARPAAHR